MENFILAFTVVFPLTVYMGLGYMLSRKEIWSSSSVEDVNRLCFNLFMPVLLFENIRGIDLSMGIDLWFLFFACISIVLSFIFLCLIVPRIEKDNARRGVMIQGVFRSNFVLFGIPVAMTLSGQEDLGGTAALMAVTIPTFNVLSVMSLEIFRGRTVNWIRILTNTAKNPLIIGSVFGLIALAGHISLPQFIESTTASLGRVTTPLALIALGSSFRFEGAKNCLRQLSITVACKLLIMPALWLSVAALLGFRGIAMIGLLPLYGSPIAVASYTMALQMDGDAELASQQVVYSSVFSILTMFFWIVVLKELGMF